METLWERIDSRHTRDSRKSVHNFYILLLRLGSSTFLFCYLSFEPYLFFGDQCPFEFVNDRCLPPPPQESSYFRVMLLVPPKTDTVNTARHTGNLKKTTVGFCTPVSHSPSFPNLVTCGHVNLIMTTQTPN